MLRMIAATGLVALIASPAMAAERRVDPLADALGLTPIIEIMREEGLEYGREVQAEMFPGRGGPAWELVIDRLYDANRLEGIVRDRLDTELAQSDLAPLEAFFTSPVGAQIIELEISARRAMLDETVEAAAEDAALVLPDEDANRFVMLTEFAEVNDLVETNTVGAMNASYAFYMGLSDGGAFLETMTQEQMLSDVWSQEPDIRAETESWVMAYAGLAYGPLSDDDLQAYIDMSKTDEGQQLNRALFAAFDEMYVGISRGLGLGAAGFLSGEDL